MCVPPERVDRERWLRSTLASAAARQIETKLRKSGALRDRGVRVDRCQHASQGNRLEVLFVYEDEDYLVGRRFRYDANGTLTDAQVESISRGIERQIEEALRSDPSPQPGTSRSFLRSSSAPLDDVSGYLVSTHRSTRLPSRSKFEVLGELAAVAREAEELRLRMDELVAEARGFGVSWQDIGDAVGITNQSAHQRWSEKGQQSARERQRRFKERQR